jgi:flagellar hook protein FlgE
MLRTPLTGLTAASKDLSAVSNNLANANTIGFKKSHAVFGDFMAEESASVVGAQTGKGVLTIGMHRDTEQGSMKQTSGSLDVALQGEGYMVFGSSTSSQSTTNATYSRAGKLTLNTDGYLVDDSGSPVMGNQSLAGGLQSPNLQPINIFKAVGNDPTNVSSINIDPQGQVSVTSTAGGAPIPVAYIAVARFENENGMQANGGSKFSETQSSGAAQFGRGGVDGFGNFAQGNLENSNVDITSELMQMITAQQAYNGNSRALQTGSEMLRSFTEQVS